MNNRIPPEVFDQVAQIVTDGVAVVDMQQPDQPLVYINPAFERLTGYHRNQVLGRNCRFLQGPDTQERELSLIRNGISRGVEVRVTLRNYRLNGELFWNELFLSPLRDETGKVIYYLGIQHDVTRERKLQQQLSHNATHDALTGLPNRALLEDTLEQAVQLTGRHQRSVAVLYIDLDGFKPVNDHYGHHFGDLLLKEVSARLLMQLRPGDTLARIEGDEFVVVLADLANSTDVVMIAERILKEVAVPIDIGGTEVQLTASIGASISSEGYADAMSLIQQADLAMYQAKLHGRNTFQWYSERLNDSVKDFLNIRNQFQRSMEKDEFRLHYQPKFDIRSGSISGLEALARWTHDEMGEVSPTQFIPVAERTGLIIPFSEWVLEQALTDFKKLLAVDPDLPYVSVNISTYHFLRAEFLPFLEDLLQRLNFSPTKLDLEITETVLVSDPEMTVQTLEQLKRMGVHLSLDDFGIGFSNLNYLKQLPVDTVKIDRMFIADITHSKGDSAITYGIISMAHHLGKKVVAEGVETQAQLSLLRRALCDEMQGFLKARPMPFDELVDFIDTYKHREQEVLPVEEHRASILLVDDEDNILRSLQRLLRRDGYKILLASSASEAFELLAQNSVDVIISDHRMRHMNGTELLNHVKSMYPSVVRIVLSGYMDLESVTGAINQGQIYKFLTKPWDDVELRNTVRDAVILARETSPKQE